jgi:hypothetical protein
MTRGHASAALAGLLVILRAAPALAFHCPALVRNVDRRPISWSSVKAPTRPRSKPLGGAAMK